METICAKCLGTDPHCPECLGTGLVQARIAIGEMFTVDCIDCGAHVGGGVMGGESPIRELPPDKTCFLCGGTARARKDSEGC